MAEIPDDEHYYLRALREELKLSSEIGMDEAARRTAEKLIEYADPPAVNYKANLLKYEINLKGNDARAALDLLKIFIINFLYSKVYSLSYLFTNSNGALGQRLYGSYLDCSFTNNTTTDIYSNS